MESQSTKKIIDKIKTIEIQGAHNVALAGLTALENSLGDIKAVDKKEFLAELRKTAKAIALSRPTEPTLRNALSFVLFRVRDAPDNIERLKEAVVAECRKFTLNLKNTMEEIHKIGARRITDNSTVFTHCHSNTVCGILKEAKKEGKNIKVICTETRPKFQGYLTARELAAAGIPVTLIVDSAARVYMKRADIVLLGADAISVNGAVINKIGSSLISLAAKEQRKPVYVVAGIHKIDPITFQGFLEPIEQRSPDEITAPISGVVIENPAFDVIPPDYVDLIITERGVIPPAGVYSLMEKEFSWLKDTESWWE